MPIKKSTLEARHKKQLEDTYDLMLDKQIVNLDLSGILYVAAFENLVAGEKLYKKLTRRIETYNGYKGRKDQMKLYREFMVKKLRELEIAYEPVLKHLSVCKLLLVNCIESFINEMASEEFTSRQLQEFDKLSITGKLLFLPSVLRFKRNFFTLDKKPLQDFSATVTDRNKLVHFKGRRNELKDQNLPDFLHALNLTPESCRKGMEAVKTIIEMLCSRWKGSSGPYWLHPTRKSFRRPCFYLYTAKYPSYLYSSRYDTEWMKNL